MASMMGGDFVEAYVLKNAYKDKLRRMDQAQAALDGAKSGKDDKEAAGVAGEKKKAAPAAGGGGASSWGGFFGLMKKKVHPRPKASS